MIPETVAFDVKLPIFKKPTQRQLSSQENKVHQVSSRRVLDRAFPVGSVRRYIATYVPITIFKTGAGLVVLYIALKALQMGYFGAKYIGHSVIQNLIISKHDEHSYSGENFVDFTWGVIAVCSVGAVILCCTLIICGPDGVLDMMQEHHNKWKSKQKKILDLQKMEEGIVVSKNN